MKNFREFDPFLEKLARGIIDRDEALNFFKSLFEWSTTFCKENISELRDYFPTNQYYNSWLDGTPKGVCDHFTASSTAKSTLRWFSAYDKWNIRGKKRRSKSSAEFVIDVDGTIFCLMPFWEGKASWHEAQVNRKLIGIEHVNCGPLKKKGKDYYWYPGKFNTKYPYQYILPAVKAKFRGYLYYAGYSREQIIANILLKRALISLYGSRLDKDWFIQHDQLRKDKLDMGPLWPTKEIKEVVFDKGDIRKFKLFSNHYAIGDNSLDTYDVTAYDPEDNFLFEPSEATKFEAYILDVQKKLQDLNIYLGPLNGVLTSQTKSAIMIYQQREGLFDDGFPGNKTLDKLGINACRDVDYIVELFGTEVGDVTVKDKAMIAKEIEEHHKKTEEDKVEEDKVEDKVACIKYKDGKLENGLGDFLEVDIENCQKYTKSKLMEFIDFFQDTEGWSMKDLKKDLVKKVEKLIHKII